MEDRSYAEAGRIFEKLAFGAMRMRIPRAPALFLQAGRAFILAEDNEHGIRMLRRGLRLMVDMRQIGRLQMVTERVAQDLKEYGLEAEGIALKEEIDQILSHSGFSKSSTTFHLLEPRLPGNCPQCGGPVHPDEIVWIDKTRAECEYCRSILEVSR